MLLKDYVKEIVTRREEVVDKKKELDKQVNKLYELLHPLDLELYTKFMLCYILPKDKFIEQGYVDISLVNIHLYDVLEKNRVDIEDMDLSVYDSLFKIAKTSKEICREYNSLKGISGYVQCNHADVYYIEFRKDFIINSLLPGMEEHFDKLGFKLTMLDPSNNRSFINPDIHPEAYVARISVKVKEHRNN